MAYVSPSQIETYSKLCKRKWGYRYIDKIKHPPKPSAQFGIDGHARIERWLLEGEEPGRDEIGSLVHKAILPGLLPTPFHTLCVEEKFEVPLLGGTMLGFIDAIHKRDDGTHVITDHKFRGQARYAMGEDDLRKDIQALVYSWAVFKEAPDADRLLNRWLYYIKKPQRVFKIEIERTRADTMAAFDKDIVPVFKEIISHYAALEKGQAHELPPCYASCGAYGGCDYLDICKPSSGKKVWAKIAQSDAHKRKGRSMAEDKRSYLDILKEQTQKRRKEKREEEAPPKDLKAVQEEKGAKGVNPEEAPPPDPPKKKRGRKKKVEAPPQSEERAVESSEIAGDGDGRTVLVVGAAIVKGEVGKRVLLADLLRPVYEKMRELYSVTHWSQIEYGKGRGILCELLEAYLDSELWDGGIIIADTSETSEVVKEVLIRKADVVIWATA